MTMEPDRDGEVLAGEYVLGLLDGADRQAFERRMDEDDACRASVEHWRRRLAPIDATAPSIAPSAGLWPRIEAGLGAAAIQRRAAVQALTPIGRLQRWWSDLVLWRSAAFAGLAASILLGLGLLAALDRAGRQPVMVAVLMTEGNVAAAVVNTFADGRVELLPLQDIAVPHGRALEIWTLWDRAVGPRSVGLIDRARSVPLRLDSMPLGADQLFEITLEPRSGSPTGRPTGPIIAKGLTARSL